jgi:rhomboid family GlyGly-CTERM serine protease
MAIQPLWKRLAASSLQPLAPSLDATAHYDANETSTPHASPHAHYGDGLITTQAPGAAMQSITDPHQVARTGRRRPAWTHRWPWRSAVLIAVALLLYLLAGPAPQPMLLDLDPVSWSMRPWTLLTGHLVHAGPSHLHWDLAGLLLVALVYEPLLGERLWPVLLGGALAIDLGLGLGLGGPALERYCGLSGLINALVGAGLLAAWRCRDRAALSFGLLVVAKVTIEAATGDALITVTAWPPVPVAHLLGLAGGGSALLIVLQTRRRGG